MYACLGLYELELCRPIRTCTARDGFTTSPMTARWPGTGWLW